MKTTTYIMIETNGEEIIKATLEIETTINGVELPTSYHTAWYEEAEKLAAWAAEKGVVDTSTEFTTSYVVEG